MRALTLTLALALTCAGLAGAAEGRGGEPQEARRGASPALPLRPHLGPRERLSLTLDHLKGRDPL